MARATASSQLTVPTAAYEYSQISVRLSSEHEVRMDLRTGKNSLHVAIISEFEADEAVRIALDVHAQKHQTDLLKNGIEARRVNPTTMAVFASTNCWETRFCIRRFPAEESLGRYK